MEYLTQIKSLLPSWSNVEESNLDILRLTGVTNVTYRVKYNGQDETVKPRIFLLRKFGASAQHTFIDPVQENEIYRICASSGFGPQIHGLTSELRLEEWIDGVIMDPKNMCKPEYYQKIARHLADFHQQKPENFDKRTTFEKMFNGDLPILKATLQKINDTEFNEQEKNQIQQMLVLMNPEEIESIKRQFPNDSDLYVFSHMDLLANNILIENSTQNIKFIDFEYSSFNLVSFDIANYFNESQYDYSVSEYPWFGVEPGLVSLDQIKDFTYHYVCGLHKLDPEEDHSKNDKFQEKIQKIMDTIPLGMALSHYLWTLWGIFMSKNPQIDLDYIGFSYSRFKKYQECKQKYLN